MNDEFDDLDHLLHAAEGGAPPGFAAQVMRQIAALPQPLPLQQQPARWRRLAQRLALIAAAALGTSQVLAFIFGLWAVTAAAAA